MIPIFIAGITHRSGTNFLSNLLGLHPDCIQPKKLHEDWFLASSRLLVEYLSRTAEEWNTEWFDVESRVKYLSKSFGDLLVNFSLQDDLGFAGKHVVLKTPSTRGIENLFLLFPNAKLIILARDGKDTCESIVKGFLRPYDSTFRLWNRSAKRVNDFWESAPSRKSVFYTRYERLYHSRCEEMSRILDFCELDSSGYNYAYASNYPIIGSSTKVDRDDKVHWRPVGWTEDFRPTNRSEHWSEALHVLFNEICGVEARKLDRAFG